MDRRDFRTWGVELSAGDFAQALAAVGVLQAALSRWPLFDSTPDGIAEMLNAVSSAPERRAVQWGMFETPSRLAQYVQPTPASVLADAWRRSGLPGRASLQLEARGPYPHETSAPGDLVWVAQQLARPEVGVRSVYVRVDEPAVEVGWQWPMRVGVLRDPRSSALRSARAAGGMP